MGSCCSSTVDSHGHAKNKVPAFAWSVAVKKIPYSPFSEAKADIVQPPACAVPDGGKDNCLPSFELCPRWPPGQVITGGADDSSPWDAKAAIWFNKCWVKAQLALPNHLHGRELVLSASFAPDGGLAALLLSTGWLFRMVRKPKKEPWLQTLHILEIKAVRVNSGPVGFTVQIDGGAKPSGDPLPPADAKVCEAAMKKGIEHGATGTMSWELTQQQAEKLVGSIVAAAITLKLRVPELQMEQGFKPAQIPTPAPQCDGGFAASFRAYMAYLGAPCAEVKVGLPFLDGLPYLQLDLTEFEPLSGTTADSARTAYAVRAALRTCTTFKSMVRVGKPIGAAAWPSICQAVTSGSLFKVALQDCALDSRMVQQLGDAMAKDKAPIMDLDLTGAQIKDGNAAAALAKGLEAVPAGLRRLVLARCGMTSATAPVLLKVIAGTAGKKLEHLNLAGNTIGTLPAPHPLSGFLRSGKLQSLDLSGTGLDMSMVLTSQGASDEAKGTSLRSINVSGTTCCVGGQQLPKPVEQFIVSMGKNLQTIRVGDFMQSAMAVKSYIRALSAVPSKDYLLDMSGLQAVWVVEAVSQVAKSGQLPGKGLVLDYMSANMEQSAPDAIFNTMELEISLEFGKAAQAKAAASAATAPPGVVVAVPAVSPAELQKKIADQSLDKLRKSGTGRAAQLEQLGQALSTAGNCKQLLLTPPTERQSKRATLQHHMWASGALSGPKPFEVPAMGIGPQAALLLAPLAVSKDITHLDLRGVYGGDALGVVLGVLVLRTNRSLRSIQLQGNMISVNGWAAIRGAFYGNKKVVNFPFPESDVKTIVQLYQQRMAETEQEVLQCRWRIKRAFKSTKGARTPYVLGVLNKEVNNIKGIKQEQARQRVTLRKYAKLQQEIQEAIARNQSDAKNKEKQAKEFNNQWKEADKALERATKLQDQKDQALERKKADILRQRSTVMQQWTDKVTELRKKKKDVRWFEEWARMVAKPVGDPPVNKPVLSHETADLLLSLVPDALTNDCKKEIGSTKDFIAAEMEIVAEQELLQSRLEEQRCVAARVIETASAARMSPPPQFNNVQAATSQKVVTGTVVMPSEVIVARPVEVQNKRLQATQYQQFQMHQAQQAERANEFNSRPGQSAPGRFASAFMFSRHHQQRQAEQRRGFGGAGGSDTQLWMVAGMMSTWHGGGHRYYGHYDQHYYDAREDDPGHWDPNPEGRGEDWIVDDGGHGALEDLDVPPEGEGLAPIDIGDATEAVDAYAGGEDDRIGGGPPSSGRSAAKDEIILKPTPPRLDVVEWFETQIQHCERRALEATLGRLGALPCQQEVLLRCGPAEPRGVCLVTQCSLDRLARLEQQLCAWDGEVAVAIFIDAAAEGLAAATARRDIIATCSRAASRRAAIASSISWTVTVVYRLDDAEVRCESYDRLYPVNTLRNVALRSARSELVFLLDVDFIPSRNLHATLCGSEEAFKSLTSTLAGGGSDAPLALVVAAFEVKSPSVPQTFSELQSLVSQGDADGFHVSTFPRGHSSTNFRRWFEWTSGDATGASSCEAAMDFETHGMEAYCVDYTEHYEPYVICHRAFVPAYEERFRGYGLNKISHLYDMATQGFRFCVLADHEAFVTAQQHPRSESWQKMYGPDADIFHRARLSVHYAQFRKEVAARAGRLLHTPALKSRAQCVEEPRVHEMASEPDELLASEDTAAWLAVLLIHLEKLASAERIWSPAAHAAPLADCVTK